MKKSHVENTVGPWARQKLDGLEAYLHAYTMALKRQPFELVYIDAFAGAGRSKIRTAWEGADDEDLQLFDDEFVRAEQQFIEGSPHRALILENPFSQYYFFDADAGRAALLEGLRIEYPGRKISVKVGDANALIQEWPCGSMVGTRRALLSLIPTALTSTGEHWRHLALPRSLRSSSTFRLAWPSTG